ncbi:hypothetical protein K7432_006086 [Basidiobolus ranarum]|uniref:t-SNARE coiled-coil homology domain-containing protein n=1 Tax=Basidiobolus ranarum TaxID=34480 RepID=A0ABR2WVH1_9FUNG
MDHQTGKTYTLIEIIRQLAKQEKKILVCGPSNISVDNLVERLAKCRLNILRVGHPARILPAVVEHALDVVTQTCDQGQLVNDIRKEMDQTMANIQKSRNRTERKGYYQELRDLKREFRVREGRVVEELFEETPVILSTLNGCGSRTMKNRKFDVVIIDEATQALEGNIPIFVSC